MNKTPPPQILLQVENVNKHYGTQLALNKVSLQVQRGEFIALLGLNGAGKTTLFQLLSGLFTADAGNIHIVGYDVSTHLTRALARLGIVFQQPTLDLSLTVRANLRFHARLHGMGQRTDDRIQTELTRVGLQNVLHTVCGELSGGSRRKVELARALLHEPALLLMDEATVGLDPASRQGLLEHVKVLCDVQGMGVLWATHLVDEVEAATRVVVLHRGKVLCDVTPAALKAQMQTDNLSNAFLALTRE